MFPFHWRQILAFTKLIQFSNFSKDNTLSISALTVQVLAPTLYCSSHLFKTKCASDLKDHIYIFVAIYPEPTLSNPSGAASVS